MLQIVRRSSTDIRSTARPANSTVHPCAPSTPIAPIEVQDEVLGARSRRRIAGQLDAHRASPLHEQALRGEHLLHLGGPHAPRERAEAAHGAGVAVVADHGQPRKRDPLLRREHVHDALAGVADVEQAQAVAADPGAQLADERLAAAGTEVRSVRPGRVSTTWSTVAKTDSGRADGAPGVGQLPQREPAAAVVHHDPVDVDQAGPDNLGHEVLRADLVDDVGRGSRVLIGWRSSRCRIPWRASR